MSGRRAPGQPEAVDAPAAVLDFDGSKRRLPAPVLAGEPRYRHWLLLLMWQCGS
jgi:hypothetical protein